MIACIESGEREYRSVRGRPQIKAETAVPITGIVRRWCVTFLAIGFVWPFQRKPLWITKIVGVFPVESKRFLHLLLAYA